MEMKEVAQKRDRTFRSLPVLPSTSTSLLGRLGLPCLLRGILDTSIYQKSCAENAFAESFCNMSFALNRHRMRTTFSNVTFSTLILYPKISNENTFTLVFQ